MCIITILGRPIAGGVNSSLFLRWPWQDTVLSAREEPFLQFILRVRASKTSQKRCFATVGRKEQVLRGQYTAPWQCQQGGSKDS